MRSRTYGQRELVRQAKRAAKRGESADQIPKYWRPQNRSECRDGPRPCPFVACKFNLFLDITPRGGLRVPFGEEPEDLDRMTESCALDIAERGPVTLEYIASVQAITRERVRQIEITAIERMQSFLAEVMADDTEFGPVARDVMQARATQNAEPASSINELRNKSQRAKKAVFDWIDDVGSPPVD